MTGACVLGQYTFGQPPASCCTDSTLSCYSRLQVSAQAYGCQSLSSPCCNLIGSLGSRQKPGLSEATSYSLQATPTIRLQTTIQAGCQAKDKICWLSRCFTVNSAEGKHFSLYCCGLLVVVFQPKPYFKLSRTCFRCGYLGGLGLGSYEPLPTTK